MTPPFQKTLYRFKDQSWEYIRFHWLETSQGFEVFAAPCGQESTHTTQESVLPGETKENALHRLALPWRRAGYLERPVIEQFLDLEILIPDYEGAIAATPWFESLQFNVIYPLLLALENTANGTYNGGWMPGKGRMTYLFWILDPVAALKCVEDITRQAAPFFQVSARTRRRGEPIVRGPIPGQTPDVSAEDDFLFRMWSPAIKLNEDSQYGMSLPQRQPIPALIGPDLPRAIDSYTDPARVRGEKASQLREQILARWNVGKGSWPPLGNAAPCETLHIEGIERKQAHKLTEVLQQQGKGQVYAFIVSDGFFVSEHRRIFSTPAVEDTYWFDEGFEWIIYESHHNTITFGGDWLLKEFREVFREEPGRINPWGN